MENGKKRNKMTNAETFKEKGYCVIRSAISKELCDFVTQYALFDEMQDFNLDETQVVGAHAKYADPAMETLLVQLHETMEKNTGLTLFPTYSFYRVYRNGHILKPHTDRPSCEISTTMCLNYSYENYSWPIYMEGNSVELNPGDMVIYRGCDLKHWRDEFKTDNLDDWHVQGFFHYVDANGPYTDYKFDRRNSVGEFTKKYVRANQVNKPYIQYL